MSVDAAHGRFHSITLPMFALCIGGLLVACDREAACFSRYVLKVYAVAFSAHSACLTQQTKAFQAQVAAHWAAFGGGMYLFHPFTSQASRQAEVCPAAVL